MWVVYCLVFTPPTPPTVCHLPTPVTGVAQGVLGVTGIETSANFVEEQRAGVYPKTVKDMWLAATIFNPLIALFALGVCSREELMAHPNDLRTQL